MVGNKRFSLWVSERLGLTMIVASLAVIIIIIGMLFQYQQDSREAQIRSQGIGLTRLLSGMPYEQLVTPDSRAGLLQVVRKIQSNEDFSYGVVVDPQGNLLNEAVDPGIIVPNVPLPREPSSWMGERILVSGSDERNILEFHAPLIVEGNLAGYVRLGFFQPGFGLSHDQLPFFATLALPIFLLTPLFYFLVKRETEPLTNISQAIDGLIDRGNFQQVRISTGGEVGEFMRRFNRFGELVDGRIKELEQNQCGLQASAKLLAYKRERIETVLQSMPEAIVVLDEAGAITYANAKFSPLLGIENESPVGSKIEDWCHNPEILTFLSKYERGTSTSFSSDSVEFNPKDAPEKTIKVTAHSLFAPHDETTTLGTLIVFRDSTQETMAKKHRGEFVAHIAHELKTPLNVLAMYSEALQGEDGREEAFRIDAVNVIHDEVERLSTLINNLLSLTKFEMGSIDLDRGRVKLKGLLQDAFENVSRSGRGNDLEFALDLPKEISSIHADKDLLRIAINNLLTNAIKYNSTGGTVTMSAEESDNKIEIRISDTGIGIAPDEIEKVFEKFYRSNDENVRSRTGHGLGLPLAKEIVELHHGLLHVESVLGQGTEFTIEFYKNTGLLE